MQPQPSNIVILTGAGISKESGLATFRGAGGMYERANFMDVATPAALARDPMKVHAYYNARRAALQRPHIVSNAAHHALARLQRRFRGSVLLVTQNVDDLHERAGSQDVLHMHGELLKARCIKCGAVHHWPDPIDINSACPECIAEGHMRMHVVLFNEMPLGMDRIESALRSCDLFVSIGTSGTVYPAADFVDMASRTGAHTVELNLEPSEGHSDSFQQQIYGLATEVVPQFVDQPLSEPLGSPSDPSCFKPK